MSWGFPTASYGIGVPRGPGVPYSPGSPMALCMSPQVPTFWGNPTGPIATECWGPSGLAWAWHL